MNKLLLENVNGDLSIFSNFSTDNFFSRSSFCPEIECRTMNTLEIFERNLSVKTTPTIQKEASAQYSGVVRKFKNRAKHEDKNKITMKQAIPLFGVHWWCFIFNGQWFERRKLSVSKHFRRQRRHKYLAGLSRRHKYLFVEKFKAVTSFPPHNKRAKSRKKELLGDATIITNTVRIKF